MNFILAPCFCYAFPLVSLVIRFSGGLLLVSSFIGVWCAATISIVLLFLVFFSCIKGVRAIGRYRQDAKFVQRHASVSYDTRPKSRYCRHYRLYKQRGYRDHLYANFSRVGEFIKIKIIINSALMGYMKNAHNL